MQPHPHLERWQGRSRALRSNWLYLPMLGILFDAGDGCATELGTQLGSPRWIAITHGHGDHVLGLPALLAARQFPSMSSGGPVTVFHPAGCPAIAALQRAMRDLWPYCDWDRVEWTPLQPGDRVAVGPTRSLHAFEALHAGHLPCLGYAVVEERKRRSTFGRSLSQEQLVSHVREHGRSQIDEPYQHTLVAHTGDTRQVDSDLFQNADVLIYDCTFLSPEDRDEPTHAALAEVLVVAQHRNVRTLVLHHLSLRYDRGDAETSLTSEIHSVAPPFAVWLWDEDRMIPLYTPPAP